MILAIVVIEPSGANHFLDRSILAFDLLETVIEFECGDLVVEVSLERRNHVVSGSVVDHRFFAITSRPLARYGERGHEWRIRNRVRKVNRLMACIELSVPICSRGFESRPSDVRSEVVVVSAGPGSAPVGWGCRAMPCDAVRCLGNAAEDGRYGGASGFGIPGSFRGFGIVSGIVSMPRGFGGGWEFSPENDERMHHY